MPAFVEATATANASKEAVWKILADFPNIANSHRHGEGERFD